MDFVECGSQLFEDGGRGDGLTDEDRRQCVVLRHRIGFAGNWQEAKVGKRFSARVSVSYCAHFDTRYGGEVNPRLESSRRTAKMTASGFLEFCQFRCKPLHPPSSSHNATETCRNDSAR